MMESCSLRIEGDVVALYSLRSSLEFSPTANNLVVELSLNLILLPVLVKQHHCSSQ